MHKCIILVSPSKCLCGYRAVPRGNALLETILTIPLLLLLLFSLTDIGLGFLEQATLRDSLGAALESDIVYSRSLGALKINPNLGLELEPNGIENLLDGVVIEAANRLTQSRAATLRSTISNIEISAAAIDLTIDEKNGRLLGYRIFDCRRFSGQDTSTQCQLSSEALRFIQEKISSARQQEPSLYANYLSERLDPQTNEGQAVFLSRSVLLFLEVAPKNEEHELNFVESMTKEKFRNIERRLVPLRLEIS